MKEDGKNENISIVLISVVFIVMVSVCYGIVSSSVKFIHSGLVAYQHSRYDRETFNCVDFTAETIKLLRIMGITSYQVVGTFKDNSSMMHSWVGISIFGIIVHFEPQDLVFFNPENDFKCVYINKK